MHKNINIPRKSEKNELELENHKKQVFLHKKRKCDSNSSFSDSGLLSSPNHHHSNPYKNNFFNNFSKDLSDHEVIDITGAAEETQNPNSYINLVIDGDSKITITDSESEDKFSKQFFQNRSTNSSYTSTVPNNLNITHQLPFLKNNSNNLLSNNSKEKFIKELGFDLQDDYLSSKVVVELNISNGRGNSKSDLNKSHTEVNFIQSEIINNCEQAQEKGEKSSLDFNNETKTILEKDFIKFQSNEEKLKVANNMVNMDRKCLNTYDMNSEKFFPNNDTYQIENINSIPTKDFFPWISEKTKNLHGMLKLHQEILDFYEFIKPTSEEDKLRDITVRKIKALIKQELPDCTVKTFGSFPSKIHLPDSDVDIVVLPPEDKKKESPENQTKILKKILNKLVKENCVDYIRLIDSRVPIIRATLKETKINIDISANGKNGYEAKKVIKKILEDFPCMRPLMYVLKYFLRQRKLNESYTGGISSFLLFNLVLSYLQYVVKNYKNNGGSSSDKTLCLGDLLVGFLQFFAFDFNFEEVGISVKYGGYFYKKSERGWLDTKRSWQLSVENFQDPDQDIGKGSFKFKKILDCFKQARDALYYPCAYPVESYLGQFVNVDKLLLERFRQLNLYNNKLK